MDGWTELTPASLPDDKETPVRVMWQKRDGDIRLDEPVPLRKHSNGVVRSANR